ncbi:hypothetical protein ACI2L1_36375 [Streptomyces sp. NPDC019531]|uniref:hypothetical protein n=1 Tax=Streptomyces sp. NPDC019531 TaxID=3365062 RepID=UPI00384D7EF9
MPLADLGYDGVAPSSTTTTSPRTPTTWPGGVTAPARGLDHWGCPLRGGLEEWWS